MALVNKEVASGASVTPPTTIVRQFSGSVIYTVPLGRKFKGILTAAVANVVSINGVNVNVPSSYAVPIEVLGGTIFGGGGANQSLVGIESDA